MENSRILIIDDNPEIREVITILLEGEGFVTEEASDGEQALEKIREISYDLILLDVMMPGLNGYQTCVEIRKITNAPILFLSARSQVEDKTMGTGCDRCRSLEGWPGNFPYGNRVRYLKTSDDP